jgi:insulysin
MSSPVPSMASIHTGPEKDGGAVGREMRRRLLEWWSREYCAGRMKLCIIGNGLLQILLDSQSWLKSIFSGTESLEQLATLTSTLFSPILNRGQEPVTLVSQHPFGPNERSVSTLSDYRILSPTRRLF